MYIKSLTSCLNLYHARFRGLDPFPSSRSGAGVSCGRGFEKNFRCAFSP